MLKIGFYNNKGGVGKTTAAINTAFVFSQMKKKIIAVDCDNQRNLFSFFENKKYEPDIISQYFSENLLGNSEILNEKFDIMIYDLPPAMNDYTKSIISDCNAVFVPIDLSGFALSGLKNVILETKNLGGVFISKFNKNRSGDRAMLETLQNNFGEKLLNTIIPDSAVISSSILGGVTAFEYMHWTSAAIALGDLAAEILEISKKLGGENL